MIESYHGKILTLSYGNPPSIIELRALDENINRRKAPWATVVTVLDSPAAWGNGWLGMVGTLGIGTMGIGTFGIGIVGIGIVGFWANLKLPQRGDITNLQHASFLKLKQWQE